ncbi:hypothetical protein PanWU01x14_307770 [Parasponia andersonii]|uniref:Uncharacterized protein n=1 Tax=Parasponia andersonii TaxID=3476 RepID=A0A2P5AR95_PARAD|nr:hypothetical protein PanWU01x14_307770 [Parasponia andersonii]
MAERPKPERCNCNTAFFPDTKAETVETMDTRVKSKIAVSEYEYFSWMTLEVNATRKWINMEAAEQPKASESKARKYRNEAFVLKIA